MSPGKILFGTGSLRTIEGPLGFILRAYAALIALGVIYNAVFALWDMLAFLVIFLSSMYVLVFLTISPSPDDTLPRPRVADWILAALSAAMGIYFWVTLDSIVQRIALFTPLSSTEMFFGVTCLLLTLEATRRATGLGLTLIVCLFLSYNLFGHLLSGELSHGYIPLAHLIDITIFTTDGVFGLPVRVAATYAFMFVLFGTLLARAGGGEFFYKFGCLVAGRTTGGTAKIAVVSSTAYGMVSGSPTSDVVTTGSITIPMMERVGYSPRMAGAIEVAASTGGSIMPPVMGSVAFIMAEYTSIPYETIAVAAIVPAILYYVGIFTQVHFSSKKQGMRGLRREEIPSVREAMKGAELFLIPLATIVGGLALGYSPAFVSFVGSCTVIAVSYLRWEKRLGPVGIFNALADTTLKSVGILAACAAAGLVIGGLSMTGLAAKFSALISVFGGGTMLGTLLIAAIATIVLGMGMPTPSVYILATVLVGPALAGLGLSVMAANMFLLYFSVLSASTPPVAVAAYAAAAIARSNPVLIAASATRLSVAAAVVPFAFAYSPELLLDGEPLLVALAIITACAGVFLIGVAISGYFNCPMPGWARMVMALGGLCLIFPSVWLALIGAGLGAIAFVTCVRSGPEPETR